MMVTLKQLAKELNVSISTVSKSLSDSHEIGIATKKKVQELAKLYNYKPNRIAINLKSGKTKTIGVILPSILNNFFAQVLFGVEKVAAKKGYDIITCISNESFKKEVAYIQVLSNGSIDGFIVAIAEETQIKNDFNHFNEAIQQRKPIVMFDRVTDAIKCNKVVVNDFDAAYQGTKHLIDLKCKNIAVVSTIDYLSVGKLRIEGYEKAVKDTFKDFDKELQIKTDISNLDNAISDLLQNKKVDGIFCIDEDASLSAIKIAKARGYKIPKDISIIGFAHEKIAKNLTPTLTTINQHGTKIGEKTAQILINQLENKNTDFKLKVIKSTIVYRDSTKK